MEKMEFKAIGSAATSILGTVSGLLTYAHQFLSLSCLVLSAIAAVYGIIVARATLKSRRIEDAKNETQICRECGAGNPPPFCPFEKAERPAKCPLTEKEIQHQKQSNE